MRTSSTQASAAVTAEWNSYINYAPRNIHQAKAAAAKPHVNSLLGGDVTGILWDQSPNYNAMCPGGSVTGCVATTMGQNYEVLVISKYRTNFIMLL